MSFPLHFNVRVSVPSLASYHFVLFAFWHFVCLLECIEIDSITVHSVRFIITGSILRLRLTPALWLTVLYA